MPRCWPTTAATTCWPWIAICRWPPTRATWTSTSRSTLAWREPVAAIRNLARVLLNQPLSDMVARRLARLRIGKDFCASIEGGGGLPHPYNQRYGHPENVFRKCVMVLVDDPSIHNEEQHHRLRRGSKPISDGRWQAWRLWVSQGNLWLPAALLARQ